MVGGCWLSSPRSGPKTHKNMRCYFNDVGSLPNPCVELSWTHLGAILGPLGAILGPSWGHLGAVLEPLGSPWGRMGSHWGQEGPDWANGGDCNMCY